MMRYLLGKCWALFAVMIIVAAVLLTFVRLMLPYVPLYQQEIEQWMGQALGQPVRIAVLEAEWHGLGPQLHLVGIDFLDADSGEVRASLQRARIGVDVLASLANAELRFGNLTISGVSLEVRRHRDGSITLAGLGRGTADDGVTSEGNEAMLAWLFSQQRLALENSTVHWYDEALSQQGLTFVNVNLELRNEGDRHQFDGSASLPNDLGRRLSFAVDLQGDLFVAGGWDGHAYVNGAGLQTAALLNWLPLPGIRVDSGVAELRLWTEWRDSRLQQLEGELSVFGLQLSRQSQNDQPRGSPEFLDALSGRFSWQRQENGWRLDVDRFLLGRWGEFWPQSTYHLEWSGRAGNDGSEQQQVARGGDANDPQARLELWADFIQIEDVMALVMLTDLPFGEGRDYALALQPAGQLRQLHLQWQSGGGEDTVSPVGTWALDSEFVDLSIQPGRRLPGVSGLSGRLIANERQGQLALQSRALRVEARPLFRQALAIDELAGDLQWQMTNDGWHWSGRDITLSNEDIQLNVNIDVSLPEQGRPHMDLVAGFVSGPNALAHTGRYLPVGIMSSGLVQWLDRALVQGSVPNGGLVFHGPLHRFPFDQTDGRFEVRLVVEDGVLDYVPDWPQLTGMEAELLFSGRQMVVNAVQGHILNANVTSMHVGINNMTVKSPLLLQGEMVGETAEVLRFLQLSPLKKRFGRFLAGVEATGQSRVALDLRVPLETGRDVTVAGTVQLQDSSLLLADGAVAITRLNGSLGFSSKGLVAKNIQGQLMGLEATFSVVTDEDSGATRVFAVGNATIEEMRSIVDPPLFDRFTGQFDWQAQLQVPGKDGAEASLLVSSDLRGLATQLPAPVDKPADQTLATVVEMHLPPTLDRPLTIQVGDDLSVILALDAQLALHRGELRFADGAAQLPPQAGIRVAGIVPVFSFTQWLPLFESLDEGAGNEDAVGVNRVTVTVADVELYQRHYDHARVEAVLKDNVWQVALDSMQAKGSVQVPLDDVTPLVMNLEHLHLVGLGGDADDEDDDPREWPPLQIQVESFHFDAIDYGSLALTASRSPAGLRLTDLQLQSPQLNIKARGDWLVANEAHFSSFNIEFSSPNVGQALSRFGYSDTIKGGKGRFTVSARWPGSPLAFALARLDGSMSIAIEDGHLLEVDPGVGRVFGLLSLQALPRRLLLDFRDVFSKGFAFDRIKGDFEVRNGQATTSNLVMKGPSAQVDVEGRIGLATRDYDQRVTVVPDVASTVPLLIALAQGPVAGGIIIALKKLLAPKIDKAATIRYTVTGSWDAPVIKKVVN